MKSKVEASWTETISQTARENRLKWRYSVALKMEFSESLHETIGEGWSLLGISGKV